MRGTNAGPAAEQLRTETTRKAVLLLFVRIVGLRMMIGTLHQVQVKEHFHCHFFLKVSFCIERPITQLLDTFLS